MLAKATKSAVAEGAAISPVLMAYTEYGSGGSGSPLLMLHGLFARRGQWQSVATKIAKLTDGRVIAADMRNHGDSPRSNLFSHASICADIALLLNQLGVKDAHVLGHGFAGRSVVQLALQNPGIVKSLIVSEATPFGVPPGFWRLSSFMKTLKSVPIKKDVPLEAARQDMDGNLKPKIRNHIIRKLVVSNLDLKPGQTTASWHFNLDSLLDNLRNACEIPDLKPDSRSNMPVTFICGEASDSLPKYHLKKLMSLFPKATVIYAGGAGYLIFKDRPQFYAEYISDFINKQKSNT